MLITHEEVLILNAGEEEEKINNPQLQLDDKSLTSAGWQTGTQNSIRNAAYFYCSNIVSYIKSKRQLKNDGTTTTTCSSYSFTHRQLPLRRSTGSSIMAPSRKENNNPSTWTLIESSTNEKISLTMSFDRESSEKSDRPKRSKND